MRLRSTLHTRIGGQVLVCLFVLGVGSAWAQSLGEVARQERLRRQNDSCRPNRVYTNEDLTKPTILEPKNNTCATVVTVPEPLPAPLSAAPMIQAESPGLGIPLVPLGDVARYYRALRQARAQEQVAKEAPVQSPRPPAATLQPVSFAPRVTLPERREPPKINRVRVERGDSLWKIAKERLGSGAKWPELAEANPQIADPNLIYVGQLINLPSAQAPAPAPDKQFRVGRGDNLWKLAESELGSGLAWRCIYEANPQLSDPGLIYPGQVLSIPRGCQATT